MSKTWDKVFEDFKYYMKMQKNFSANTVEAYCKDCQRFIDFLENNYPDIEPKEVSVEQIEKFIDSIITFKAKDNEDKMLKAVSQTRVIQSLRAMFRFMLITDIIDKDISQLVITPRLDKTLPTILEDNEIRKMIASIDVSTFIGYRNRLIIELLYATGLRVSEMVNLKIEDINFKEEFLDIIGKGNKERYVPIAHRVLQDMKLYLTDYREQQKINPKYRDYIFLSQKRGTKLTRQYINKMLNQVALQAGIDKKIHPHILRHSFATQLLRGGANILAIKEMMGHATIKSTEVYINLNTKDLRKTLKKYHPLYNKQD